MNAIAPGFIDTDTLRAALGSGFAELSDRIPLGMGHPDDIAQTVLYLASEAGRYVTGATVDVNGGLNILEAVVFFPLFSLLAIR